MQGPHSSSSSSSHYIQSTRTVIDSLPQFDTMSQDDCNILLNLFVHAAEAAHLSLQRRKTCPGMYWLLWADESAGAAAAAEGVKRPRRIVCNGKGKFKSNFFGPPDPVTGREYGPVCDTCGKAWQRLETRRKKQKTAEGVPNLQN